MTNITQNTPKKQVEDLTIEDLPIRTQLEMAQANKNMFDSIRSGKRCNPLDVAKIQEIEAQIDALNNQKIYVDRNEVIVRDYTSFFGAPFTKNIKREVLV